MVATAGWHCKQPSHLSVSGRADVSATESLPPSSATWSPSSIHHSPCCLYREKPCRPHKAYSKGAERNVHHLNASRKPSRASFATSVLRSKQLSCVDLMQSNTMQYVLTLSEHASSRALFVLLWCIHSALWNSACMKLYTEPSQAEVTPPIIHPSCWQPSGHIILVRLRRTPCYESEDFWQQAIVWTGEWPDRLRAPLTPVTGLVALSWY